MKTVQAQKKRIVIVDDDQIFATVLQLSLKKAGFDASIISTPKDALQFLQQTESYASLFIIDFDLEDSQNGRDLCRIIKATTNIPIILLSGDTSEDTATSCLYAGADYYSTKPYRLQELIAQIHVVLRSSQAVREQISEQPGLIESAGMTLDVNTRILSYENRQVSISERECAVLTLLMAKFGQENSRDTIYYSIFGKEMHPLSRSIDNLIARVRKRLAELTSDFIVLPSRGGNYRMAKVDTAQRSCA
ncbi:MAG: response regulator transcription factor [Proteobacteria bacterium]|nr:response regulator transcription factor [Pseudomonadota bacterium]MDA0928637.1 response regulator transcription factor [Pseudomonadota bacterium]